MNKIKNINKRNTIMATPKSTSIRDCTRLTTGGRAVAAASLQHDHERACNSTGQRFAAKGFQNQVLWQLPLYPVWPTCDHSGICLPSRPHFAEAAGMTES